MPLFLPRPTSRPESWNGVALLFRSRWRRGVGVVAPLLGGVVQVDAAIGAPPARTTFTHFHTHTALPAGLPRPGNGWVCAFDGTVLILYTQYSFSCACCSGKGWDAGWSMRRTHSVAPHAHRLMVSLSLTSPPAAVLASCRSRPFSPLTFNLGFIDAFAIRSIREWRDQVRRHSCARLSLVACSAASECALAGGCLSHVHARPVRRAWA